MLEKEGLKYNIPRALDASYCVCKNLEKFGETTDFINMDEYI